MHFTTLYLLRGETLENTSKNEIIEDFSDRFCYCCGETRPRYRYWCDWFQIGGRWSDILKATNGLKGERSWCNKDDEDTIGSYSVVEIKDLAEPIDKNCIYAIATKSRIIEADTETEEFEAMLSKINNKELKGVVALIDCHD